ncbi:hypothetical protein V9T40_006529 [Parthenolecanium corni]|uniref:Uncharacterized protein n=1 Tax=Parthenolecanium corni TaxID=536013 RepID=A0AAN9Y5M0_9HEMI
MARVGVKPAFDFGAAQYSIYGAATVDFSNSAGSAYQVGEDRVDEMVTSSVVDEITTRFGVYVSSVRGSENSPLSTTRASFR